MTASTVKRYLDSLAAKKLVNEDGTPVLNCKDEKFFTLPNEVFLLRLPPSAFMVYAYLLLIEDRRTHTCHPSYNTIATATGLAKNTAMKSINTLLEVGLIAVESSSYFDKRGMKWKGNNLYTILPMRAGVDSIRIFKLSLAVMSSKKAVSTRTPMLFIARQSWGSRGRPSKRTVPEWFSRPRIDFIIVVFPAPFFPNRPMISPCLTVKQMSFNTS
ncbi:helix-turn-helix domain-containing protein [Oscillospiraceae bacterium 38-13]